MRSRRPTPLLDCIGGRCLRLLPGRRPDAPGLAVRLGRYRLQAWSRWCAVQPWQAGSETPWQAGRLPPRTSHKYFVPQGIASTTPACHTPLHVGRLAGRLTPLPVPYLEPARGCKCLDWPHQLARVHTGLPTASIRCPGQDCVHSLGGFELCSRSWSRELRLVCNRPRGFPRACWQRGQFWARSQRRPRHRISWPTCLLCPCRCPR
jgi:hypothetical protein